MFDHLNNDVIARASLTPPNPEEVGHTGEPDMLYLYLDSGPVYRWYHEGNVATEATAPTIQSAFATARVEWPNLELVEYRGRIVEPGDEKKVPDVHAADEKDELAREGE